MQRNANLEQLIKQKLMGIRKDAFSTASNPAFIPYHLAKEITNAVRFLNPLMQVVTARPMKSNGEGSSNVFRYPKVTNLRPPGNYSGEQGNPNPYSPSSLQGTVNLKVSKTKVQIFDFYKFVTEGYVDSVAIALDLEARALARDFLIRYLYDNSAALFDSVNTSVGAWEQSIDTSINGRRLQKFTTGAATVLTLDMLDEALTYSNNATGGMTNPNRKRVWLMSPGLAIKLRSLINAANLRYTMDTPTEYMANDLFGYNAAPYVTFYANIPVIEINGLGGDTSGVMGTFSCAASGSGSGLAAATYSVWVSKVVADTPENQANVSLGETMADLRVDVTPTLGQKITITIASPDENAYFYKVYMAKASTSVANAKLVGVYRAKTYNSNGDLVGSVTQGGVTSNASGLVTTIDVLYDSDATDAQLLSQGVKSGMKNDIPLTTTSGYKGECFVLLDLEPVNGAGEFVYVDDSPSQDSGFFSMMPLAKTSDSDQFLMRSYSTPTMRYTSSSVLVRGVRKG